MLIKQKFRRQIREHKYEFVFALNGNEALEKLKEHPDIDVVLSDINMPGVDGLMLLTKLAEISPLIKTVIVSAYGDMGNIRTAMNRGAFDFICKPVDFEDLQLTIEKTLKYVAQLKETFQAIKENNILRMYVDETVLNFMNRREFESALMANETIEATVAFIDICSFTSISAMETCLLIRTQVEKLLHESDKLTFTPKVSIGINCGEMICGNIGSADLRRLDYTVIGDVVNTAQRLQSVAQEGQILISESAYEKVKEFFQCKKIGEVGLKNKKIAVTAYEVVA